MALPKGEGVVVGQPCGTMMAAGRSAQGFAAGAAILCLCCKAIVPDMCNGPSFCGARRFPASYLFLTTILVRTSLSLF